MLTLSASGFTIGTDFACSSSYCEARGLLASGAFRALQAGANALSTRLGVGTQITVDGKIGRQTVDLIKQLAVKVAGSPSPLATYWDTSKEEVSRDAAMIAAEIGLLLQSNVSPGSAITPPGTGPVVSTTGKPPLVYAAQIPSAGGIAPVPSAGTTITPVGPVLIPKVPLKKLAIGLGAAGLLVLGGVAISQRRKRR